MPGRRHRRLKWMKRKPRLSTNSTRLAYRASPVDPRSSTRLSERGATTCDYYLIDFVLSFSTCLRLEHVLRGSFHKAILDTVDLSYLRLPALIFTSVPRNNFKTIVKPAHVENKLSVSSNRITNVAILHS